MVAKLWPITTPRWPDPLLEKKCFLGPRKPSRIFPSKPTHLIPPTRLVWTPGNNGLGGNQQANAVARACTHRDPRQSDEEVPQLISLQYRKSYSSTAQKNSVLKMPPSCDVYILCAHIILLQVIYPGQLPSNNCPHCPGVYGSLYHVTWACQNTRSVPPIPSPSPEQWNVALINSILNDRLMLITRARATAQDFGALD